MGRSSGENLEEIVEREHLDNLFVNEGKVYAGIGRDVLKCVEGLCRLSDVLGKPYSFDFNGVVIEATPESNPKILVRQWNAEMDRRHKAYIESDTYKMKREAEMKRELEKQRRFDELIALSPEEPSLDHELWDPWIAKNSDPYGNRCFTYGWDWARLMEGQMGQGVELSKEMAEDMSHLADVDGITGFMFGCAKSILAQCWKHGETLKAVLAEEG